MNLSRSALASACLCWMAACSSEQPGTQLTLSMVLAPAQASHATPVVDGTRTLSLSSGQPLVLTKAFVTIEAIELEACPSQPLGVRPRMHWTWPSLISTAHAHGISRPNRWGTPSVVSLATPDGQPVVLGQLSPPLGRYCKAFVWFGPADADAVLPSDLGNTSMLGQSLHWEGTAPQAFTVQSNFQVFAEVNLNGLEFTAETLNATAAFRLTYDQWLEGVDLSASTAGKDILQRMASTGGISLLDER